MTGGRRAIGSILVVDAAWAEEGAFNHPAVPAGATAARLPLAGPAVLITGLDPDLLTLRRRLATILADMEERPHSAVGSGQPKRSDSSKPARGIHTTAGRR